jgi:hypothetical protein
MLGIICHFQEDSSAELMDFAMTKETDVLSSNREGCAFRLWRMDVKGYLRLIPNSAEPSDSVGLFKGRMSANLEKRCESNFLTVHWGALYLVDSVRRMVR